MNQFVNQEQGQSFCFSDVNQEQLQQQLLISQHHQQEQQQQQNQYQQNISKKTLKKRPEMNTMLLKSNQEILQPLEGKRL